MSSIDNLRNKTILVGKEPGNGRLFVSVKINGQPKTAAIGEMNSVPNSVSRCKPAENTAHCKIEIDGNGNLIVTNLKPQNVTYVNGAEIVSKKVKPNGMIELGKDRYSVSVNTIIETASKIVGVTVPPPLKEFNIKPLKKVWDNYHDENIKIKKRGQELGAAQSFTPILTLGSTAISAIAAPLGFADVCYVTIPLIIIGVFLMIRNYNKRKNDTSIEDGERLLEEFQHKYVCPNPDCKHFLGMQSYIVLRQTKKCPWCGCTYVEK